jgi:multidrug efflux pump subunit AcrB
MWIVKLALRRPYTFVVTSMLVVLLGIVTVARMPTDILPEIDIPVIAVVWQYAGLPAEEMEQRFTSNYERALTTTVNDIEHIESQSLAGIAVVKVFFQPGAKIEAATAQVTAISQTVIRQMPPGATPPLVIRYSASNVPIVQIGLQSESLPEQQIFDLGANFLRTGLATVQGAQIPWPYGGKMRAIVVDLDLEKLHAHGLTPVDVSNAVNAQNLVLPAGTAKIGETEYGVRLNSSPDVVAELDDLPVKTVNGTTVFLRDVAHVRDGFSPQTSMVHANGRRAALMSVLKAGGASTIDIVRRVRAAMPGIAATLPKELEATLLFDQSVFVRAAVEGVVKEAVIAAGLTALMILLFLGSWRSTLIVVVSIPLSILVAVILLGALGHTLNTMTLGGMALAVGILVDDATVEIENIHRNLGQKKPLVRAILDGAQQIAVPAFVSTLCICIVFVPIAFLTGAVRSLFLPLGLSVVFAMMTSYFLSRTLVPTMVRALLAKEEALYAAGHDGHAAGGAGPIWALHRKVNAAFERLRAGYGRALAWALDRRLRVAGSFLAFTALSAGLAPLLGADFFPAVDAGQIRLHVRGAPGTRIEETEKLFGRVEGVIRDVIPASEIEGVMDNMGVPNSGINLALSEGTLISPADGEVLVSLREHHRPTRDHVRALRARLAAEIPGATFFFQAADISTQVLNFGIPAPIDVEIVGPRGNQEQNLAIARDLVERVKRVPGAVDVHLAQVPRAPELRVDVDRSKAASLGLTQRDVASDVLVSLSSSGQTAPSFWLDRKRGVQYAVSVQTPQWRVDSIDALRATPVTPPSSREAQVLENVATVGHASAPVNITHFNIANTIDVQANVDGADLGSVAAGVERAVAEVQKTLPRGTTVRIKGQVESMRAAFTGLGYGLVFAIVLVYLLMVVNFQSWLDPLVILMALPGALAGIVWMLFVTQTTLSVPSQMGAIMSIGVATANSILLVTFANDQRATGLSARDAALAAGITRLRPVVMTALAMIIGMLPMSLGLGEGGEQNAPLGRAVIGGLLLATLSTLFFVPVMHALLRKKAPPAPAADDEALA